MGVPRRLPAPIPNHGFQNAALITVYSGSFAANFKASGVAVRGVYLRRPRRTRVGGAPPGSVPSVSEENAPKAFVMS